jgi:D-arabinose 1-dehydrogenase-like Zn-dependent alcohol dehydrogenase
VYAFTRPGDEPAQQLARKLGAVWAGSSSDRAPAQVDAAIVFAPDGALVALALKAVAPGGTVVWRHPHERHPVVRLRAPVARAHPALGREPTRDDGMEFLALAPQVPVRTHITTYALERRERVACRPARRATHGRRGDRARMTPRSRRLIRAVAPRHETTARPRDTSTDPARRRGAT